MGAATKVIWENTEQKSAEILTECLPAGELLAWELGLGIRNILEKCSWVPKYQRHPEIPSISTKPRNCNSNLSSGKVKNSLERGKTF